jgi:hypothetical protein
VRSLTLDEQHLLEGLLAHDVPGVESLREQVVKAKVSSSCACGCGSIGFDHPPVADKDVASLFPVEGEVLGDHGVVIGGLILFVKGGWLHDLEVYSVGETALPLPDVVHVRWSQR